MAMFVIMGSWRSWEPMFSWSIIDCHHIIKLKLHSPLELGPGLVDCDYSGQAAGGTRLLHPLHHRTGGHLHTQAGRSLQHLLGKTVPLHLLRKESSFPVAAGDGAGTDCDWPSTDCSRHTAHRSRSSAGPKTFSLGGTNHQLYLKYRRRIINLA